MIQKVSTLLGLLFLVVSFISGLIRSTLAQPTAPETAYHRNSIENRFLPPPKISADYVKTKTSINTNQPAIGSEYPYSKMVFESARDNNWEIYIGNPGTFNSTHTRLTNHPANDLLPRLNRGSTKIAFISNRTGNYEIFTMNLDGSALIQLTFNNEDDVYPAWSPDGKKIAFQSYRDGQAEIYVMNTDGSNQTRITYSSDFDGQPGWSPDGKKLVFCAYRNGGYRIWVMNPDGTGQVQLSNQPYSGDPVWSPDGKYIAYDSDHDNDGWYDIWMMESNGSGQRKLDISKTSTTDLYARGWSPDSVYISYTEVNYTLYNGQWYWYSSFLAAVEFRTFDWSGYLCYDSDNWEPDWQTTEITIPRSIVLPLPEYSPASDYLVTWHGNDAGPAGIKSYTIQTQRNGSGVWEDWLVNTLDTSINRSGIPGDTIAFRVRALDEAYNLENWPETPDTVTQLYQWKSTGKVTDNRNLPIPGSLTINNPSAMNEGELSGSDGVFNHYFLADYVVTSINKNGYGILPELKLAFDKTNPDWWVLPPADNLIVNGDFELADYTQWSVTPQNGSSMANNDPLSGDYYSKTGYNFWANPRSIWHNQYSFGHPELVEDANQKLHVIWPDSSPIAGDQTPGNTDIFYSYQLSTGEWSYPVIINPFHSLGSTGPSLAAAPDGSIHAAWMDKTIGGENSYIRYAYKPASGEWSTPETVAGPINIFLSQNNHLVKVVVDGLGIVHLTWGDQSGPWYAYKISGGGWSTKANLTGFGDKQDIAVTPDNILHRIWLEFDSNSILTLLHATKPPGGNWSASEIVTTIGNINQLRLAASQVDNSLHAVWINESSLSISYSAKPEGFGWTTPISLGINGEQAYSLALSTNPEQVFVAMYGSTGQELQAKKFDNNWTAPENLGNSCYEQSLITTKVNEAKMICIQRDSAGEYDLLYVPIQYIAIPERSLSQVRSIPNDAHAPTLSFGTWIKGTASAGILDVLINGDTIYSISEPSQTWTHNWVDLSSWRGQTITITFRVTKFTDNQAFQVYLDDISIGSWLTPVISLVTPEQVFMPGAGVITISGENFISTPEVWFGQSKSSQVSQIRDHTLLAVVPEGLVPGYYDVRIINPGGQEAQKSNALLVGGQVVLPLVRR